MPRPPNPTRHVATLTLAAALAACGGGGDEAPAAPAAPTAVATEGDASKYRGTWESGCASTLVGTTVHAVQFRFNITSASGNVAGGTLTTYDYGANTVACASLPTASSTSITFTVDTTSTAVTGGFLSGRADRVTTTQTGSASSQSVYIAFAPGYGSFWLGSTPAFAATNAVYTKQP